MSGACEYNPPKHSDLIEEKSEDKRLEISRLVAMVAITIGIAWLHILQSTITSI